MTHHSTRLIVPTSGQGLFEITRTVTEWCTETNVTDGLLTIFCRHTSASLLIQENAAPEVKDDLNAFFTRVAPENGQYRHADEGPDDMPAHIRAALTQTSLSIPLVTGHLALGTWQGIYLFEHRHAAHHREVVLHLMGE